MWDAALGQLGMVSNLSEIWDGEEKGPPLNTGEHKSKT